MPTTTVTTTKIHNSFSCTPLPMYHHRTTIPLVGKGMFVMRGSVSVVVSLCGLGIDMRKGRMMMMNDTDDSRCHAPLEERGCERERCALDPLDTTVRARRPNAERPIHRNGGWSLLFVAVFAGWIYVREKLKGVNKMNSNPTGFSRSLTTHFLLLFMGLYTCFC
jgi:hypothetical protein